MTDLKLVRELSIPGTSKLVLLIMDGLGGLPMEPGGPTALEAAKTPNMDRLAREGVSGLSTPIAPGITPGSGPAHQALFGYDPLQYAIGRGVLEALGIGFPLQLGDVAVRGNFCTVDAEGRITDRRAGRIPTEKCAELVEKLRPIQLHGVQVLVEPVKDYRFALILRGKNLSDKVTETDPQRTGVAPLAVEPEEATAEAEHTAELANEWIGKARDILKDEHPANALTLRGWATYPDMPKFLNVYKLKAAAIATYPMYRGVSTLVGMEVIKVRGDESPAEEFALAGEHWNNHDFFFIHVKPTDSRGEDGDFAAKVKVIETVDQALPGLLALKPDVLVITGDHATPAVLRTHSWHPVPLLLYAPGRTRRNLAEGFGETECLKGALGHIRATDVMPLMLAHGLRLQKYGA